MSAFRLFVVALVKLACLAGFVGLALHGLASWAWPLLLLCLLTRFPASPEAQAVRPVVPAPVVPKIAA